MALSCGFFTSLNHDRVYSAEDFSRLFDFLINDGVFASTGSGLAVSATGQGMNVSVAIGGAWFNQTWSYNDAAYTITLDAAHSTLNRIDCVALEVDTSLNVRSCRFKVIQGGVATNPTKPSLVNSGDVHQYALAYVTVSAGATSITNNDIENAIGVTGGTPYATSKI